MVVREKLVELLGTCAIEESITIEPVAGSRLVDFLVNHGVTVQECIDEATTIDAIPVVRCRECVGRPFWEEDHNGVPVCLLSGLYVRSEDDFCSYGERKEGDD